MKNNNLQKARSSFANLYYNLFVSGPTSDCQSDWTLANQDSSLFFNTTSRNPR